MKQVKKILITAGNTREQIDPVRYISNISTGLMGYELARYAEKKGYNVTLISGVTALKPPKGIEFIQIVSSQDLEKALKQEFKKCDALFMTSAVCDFRPEKIQAHKIKRKEGLSLKLVKTPDLLKGVSSRKGKRKVIGFCLETENLIENAEKKLYLKNLDFIVANYLSRKSMPFGNHQTTIQIISKQGYSVELSDISKRRAAKEIFDRTIEK